MSNESSTAAAEMQKLLEELATLLDETDRSSFGCPPTQGEMEAYDDNKERILKIAQDVIPVVLKEHQMMRKALEYFQEACLCERFKTKGFDYGQRHPQMGVCDAGSRWTAPAEMAKGVLSSITLKP